MIRETAQSFPIMPIFVRADFTDSRHCTVGIRRLLLAAELLVAADVPAAECDSRRQRRDIRRRDGCLALLYVVLEYAKIMLASFTMKNFLLP